MIDKFLESAYLWDLKGYGRITQKFAWQEIGFKAGDERTWFTFVAFGGFWYYRSWTFGFYV
jgi:hypothetical protein